MFPEAESALVEKLVIANRILAHHGIVDGFGHVSVRTPEPGRFLLSRSLAPASVTRDDITLCDRNCHKSVEHAKNRNELLAGSNLHIQSSPVQLVRSLPFA